MEQNYSRATTTDNMTQKSSNVHRNNTRSYSLGILNIENLSANGSSLRFCESPNECKIVQENVIENVCKAIMDHDNTLKITKNESLNLLTSLIDSSTLTEKIKKIQVSRQEFSPKFDVKFKKYFEITAHNGIIERICFDNGSKYAFSGGADGCVKVWNVHEGMLVRSLYGHSNMVSDLCINKNGNFMVSVDYQGLLNIWKLDDFSILHSIQFSSEAIFCEFIYLNNIESSTLGNIFIIFADGTVKTVEFDLNEARTKLANKFIQGESIKNICITDGGRFVICGGWWPFFIIYDTQDLDRLIVAENFRIQTLCSAKNALKFAASSENQICSYTFYCEGSSTLGNFSRKKTGEGYWKKHVNLIESGNRIEWLCFLPSLLLVAACTDDVIRIYEDESLILSFNSEAGSIYSHPFKNIFVIVGTKITVYQIVTNDPFSEFSSAKLNITDEFKLSNVVPINSCQASYFPSSDSLGSAKVEVLFSETIYVNLNDCQFSDDGKFLITCDDQGIIKTYSIEHPISVPEHQFFMKDIDRTIETEDFTKTFNIFRQVNDNWKKTEYSKSSSSIDESILKIEALAAKTLEKDKLSEEKFIRLYINNEPSELIDNINQNRTNLSFHVNASDRDDTYIMSNDEYDTSESNVDSQESSLNKPIRRRKNVRRLIISDSESHSEYFNSRKSATTKLKSFKTARLIVDSSEDDVSDNIRSNTRRLLVSSDEESSPAIVTRRSLFNASNNGKTVSKGSDRVLRKHLRSSSPERLENSRGEYEHSRSLGSHRVLRKDIRNTSIDFLDGLSSLLDTSDNRGLNSSLINMDGSRKTKILRRDIVNNSHNLSYDTSYIKPELSTDRLLRKHSRPHDHIDNKKKLTNGNNAQSSFKAKDGSGVHKHSEIRSIRESDFAEIKTTSNPKCKDSKASRLGRSEQESISLLSSGDISNDSNVENVHNSSDNNHLDKIKSNHLPKIFPKRSLRRTASKEDTLYLNKSVNENDSRVYRAKNLVGKNISDNELLEKSDNIVESKDTPNNAIDSKFETDLMNFSYDWAAGCNIYKGTKIYFDRQNYKKFMQLEPRIKFSKSFPKESGIYEVTNVSVDYIGRIPYLSLILESNYNIKFYEYFDSEGIACTTDQLKLTKGEKVSYFSGGDCISGIITNDNKMVAYIDKMGILKSFLLTKQNPLNITPIPNNSDFKPLFGLSRSVKFKVKPICDLSTINLKLYNNLYKNTSDFLSDFNVVAKAARQLPQPYRNAARNLLEDYVKSTRD